MLPPLGAIDSACSTGRSPGQKGPASRPVTPQRCARGQYGDQVSSCICRSTVVVAPTRSHSLTRLCRSGTLVSNTLYPSLKNGLREAVLWTLNGWGRPAALSGPRLLRRLDVLTARRGCALGIAHKGTVGCVSKMQYFNIRHTLRLGGSGVQQGPAIAGFVPFRYIRRLMGQTPGPATVRGDRHGRDRLSPYQKTMNHV